jgi:hypothetical protein
MRHLIFASLCASVAGLSNIALSAEGDVDFIDYNGSGLQLFDARVQASGDGYVLSGLFGNTQSKFTLKNADVQIMAMDCSRSDDGSGFCIEIARQNLTIAESIAPRTTSPLKVTLHFPEAPLKVTGVLEWYVWVMSAERR